MEALLTLPPSPSAILCSEAMVARCFYATFPSPSRPWIHGAALRTSSLPPLPFVKVRSVPLSVRCSSYNGPSSNGPSSSGSSSSTRRWDDEDSKYLEAHVVQAVSLFPSQGHLFMTLTNGGEVEIDHVNPPKGRLLYRSRNPTIFLKIICETELLLPIIVGDVAVRMLMKAIHEETSVRPNQYHLMRDLVGSLNFEVRMVRVTERVADTYLARIFIGRPGEEEMQSVDARPSDAINLAVRCKVPIYVNKELVYTDAVTPVYIATEAAADNINHNGHVSALDCPENGRDPIAEEIILMKNMLVAVVEERYNDAARWRDELNSLRARRRWIRQL